MKGSANEVMTLAAKAARGGGAMPEQATKFGRAVTCHLIADRDPDLLRSALEALPDGPISTLFTVFESFQENALQGDVTGVIGAKQGGGLVASYAESQPVLTKISEAGDILHVTTDLQIPAQRRSAQRVTMPDDLARYMNALAARILVPESDASRLSGAGAGLTDND
jgi:hypothetical protein